MIQGHQSGHIIIVQQQILILQPYDTWTGTRSSDFHSGDFRYGLPHCGHLPQFTV